MASPTFADTDRSTSSPVFGVVTDAQTYKNVLYLFLRFPLGVTYFTLLVTGFALGIGLAVILVGLLVFPLVLVGARYVGAFEALLVNRLLGFDIDYELPDPNAEPLTDYLKGVLTDARTYLIVVYLLATFPVGIFLFMLLTLAVSLPVASILAPVLYWLPFAQYEIRTVGDAGTIVVDTFPEALTLSVVGFALALVSLHLCNVLAWGHGRATAAILTQN
ncbi:sensor domain-containing protein [Salinibaculum rarum]|uniref:sensor domain-containing protein n=1 Tax=Salinibaculum rarum TaxID=3058903 RepID=UPI00265FFE22|nr:sensor domain-containing protein [Salinibaculum sp. KK48]